MRPQRFVRSGSRRYVGTAALSVVDATSISDPELAVAHLARELLGEAQIAASPVPLHLLASLRAVVAIDEVDMPGAGMLLVLPEGGFRIQVRAEDPLGRRRFTIAHEITHLLIPAYYDNPATRADGLTGEFPAGDEEEYLCDLGARDMLLPEAMFRAECARRQPSLDNLCSVAEAFQSSLESTAIRADQLAVWPCVPVVWEWRMKPSQRAPEGQRVLLDLDREVPAEEEFRVKFHAGRRAGAFFARHRHAPRESAMVAACTATGGYQGASVLPVGEGLAECYVVARLVPYRDGEGNRRDRIISLVFPT